MRKIHLIAHLFFVIGMALSLLDKMYFDSPISATSQPKGHDLTQLRLTERREIMRSVLTFGSSQIRIAEFFEASAKEMIAAARAQEFEGAIAKRKESIYEAGKRSGAWIKYRLNRGQELVIAGFIPGTHGVESIIVGYYRGHELIS